jgi:hypothetical protein
VRISFLLSLLIFSSALFGQENSHLVDSLSKEVNTTSGEFEKALALEKALNKIVIDDLDFERFKSNLQVAYFTPRMLLTLEAQEFRVAVLRGQEPSRIIEDSESNPYKGYFLANSHFFFGEGQKALMIFNKIAPQFKALEDTFYTASTYNNIGTIHYVNNRLDSGLTYFLLAKQYTYWFNEMLEANILAVSNALSNKELSAEQIQTIHKNNPNSTNGVYYNNAYEFFDKYNPRKRDSLVERMNEVFTRLGDVPDPLYRVFIREELRCDSMANELLKMPSHIYYENALDELLRSPIIHGESFSSDVIDSLWRKSSLTKNVYRLQIYNNLDSLSKWRFIELNQTIPDQYAEIKQDELNALIESYKIDLQKSEKNAKNILITSILSLLVFVLLVTTIYFRQKAIVSKSLNEALEKNQELELAKVQLESQMNETRSKITSISRENLSKLQELKQLIQNLDSLEMNEELLKDLNIIRIHQDGITRFKINRFCEDLNSEKFIPLAVFLSTKELQVFKLMVLGFRSKEIANLIDVSHQYVNNQRHKIRSVLQEHGYEFEALIEDLRSNLYHT